MVHYRRVPLVKVGDHVEKGDLLTDGSADITELFKYGGRECAQEYIISEISRIYELQGASISRKHIEVIIKQMFSRRRIKSAGDAVFTAGDLVEERDLNFENNRVKAEKGTPAAADAIILGITEVSLSRKSFLSAASFQHTTKILINAAIRGSVDRLRGLKENVIIGRLIPAGTGYSGSPKAEGVGNVTRETLRHEDEEGNA
jgi:DNA-directed RNA polymerase subunit beta'